MKEPHEERAVRYPQSVCAPIRAVDDDRGLGETAISLYSLFQNHVDSVAYRFPNGLADFCLYRQLMRAVTHSHKRTSKWMTINLAPDSNETASTKKLY
jgi:hypothetical protein